MHVFLSDVHTKGSVLSTINQKLFYMRHGAGCSTVHVQKESPSDALEGQNYLVGLFSCIIFVIKTSFIENLFMFIIARININ